MKKKNKVYMTLLKLNQGKNKLSCAAYLNCYSSYTPITITFRPTPKTVNIILSMVPYLNTINWAYNSHFNSLLAKISTLLFLKLFIVFNNTPLDFSFFFFHFRPLNAFFRFEVFVEKT